MTTDAQVERLTRRIAELTRRRDTHEKARYTDGKALGALNNEIAELEKALALAKPKIDGTGHLRELAIPVGTGWLTLVVPVGAPTPTPAGELSVVAYLPYAPDHKSPSEICKVLITVQPDEEV
jgi:hypothetical protein